MPSWAKREKDPQIRKRNKKIFKLFIFKTHAPLRASNKEQSSNGQKLQESFYGLMQESSILYDWDELHLFKIFFFWQQFRCPPLHEKYCFEQGQNRFLLTLCFLSSL
jgi:hypothetical protein